MGSVADDCLYRTTVRITSSDWRLHRSWLERLPDFDGCDPAPPCTGPEVEIQFDVGGLSVPAAEARACGRLEARGVAVLAVHARERVSA